MAVESVHRNSSNSNGCLKCLNGQEHNDVWQVSKARLQYWPRLYERHIHQARVNDFGSQPTQRFSNASDAIQLGDPMNNVFIINLHLGPATSSHDSSNHGPTQVLSQLHQAGLNAYIVDAIDGDAFTSQERSKRRHQQRIHHGNTLPHLTTGQLGCFMSHFTIWHYMAPRTCQKRDCRTACVSLHSFSTKVEHNIPSALILEDDFDLYRGNREVGRVALSFAPPRQENFKERLGTYLEEARGLDWNLMYLGRSPTEGDVSRVTEHLAQPGAAIKLAAAHNWMYVLVLFQYIFKLDAAKALVEAHVQKRLAPLDPWQHRQIYHAKDHYFSVAMGQGFRGHWNENAVEWSKPPPTRHIPQVLRGLAITPPLVMPCPDLKLCCSEKSCCDVRTCSILQHPGWEGDPWPDARNEEEWRAAQGVGDSVECPEHI
eukprot:Skav218255  [mRNA]  locus=scaffold2035:98033:102946:- [translate_table: standard]